MSIRGQIPFGSIPKSNGIFVNPGWGVLIRSRNIAAAYRPVIKVYYSEREGRVDMETRQLATLTATGTEQFQTIPIGSERVIYGVVVDVPSATLVHPGQTFVEIGLTTLAPTDPSGTTSSEFYTLASGYLSSNSPVGFPFSGLNSIVSGLGFASLIEPGAPVAGAEVSIVVPDHQRWYIRSLSFSLTCNAAIANRSLSILIENTSGTKNLYAIALTTAITANQKAIFILNPPETTLRIVSPGPTGIDVAEYAGLPRDLVLTAGNQIVTFSSNLNAGDAYGSIIIDAVTYIDPGTAAGGSGGSSGGPT